MPELENLLKDIEKLRQTLHELIDKKGSDLQNPEVISASENLNKAITEYNDLIRKKM
ncbi:MAG: Spo0E family sporulation regulatory protein-aspartic acid phosphatase [Clostridia bacterium]